MSGLRVVLRLHLVLFVSWFSSHALSDDSVGFVPGGFSVSDAGAATYSIPIDVPPSFNGMRPSLDLIYDSSSGNGELGLGLSLSGLSEIHRCATNLVDEGFKDPVDYNQDDLFCLNGAKLVLDVSGAYYVSVSDPSIKVYAYGNFPSNRGGWSPSYWEVRRSSGISEFYGAQSSQTDVGARVYRSSTGNDVYSWKIAESVDSFGNSIQYFYSSDRSVGVYQLSEISYGGNDNYTIAIGRESRPDSLFVYLPGGNPMVISERINSIEVLSGGALSRQYKISYVTSSNGNSIVSDIELCSVSACLPKTVFNWNQTVSQVGSGISAINTSVGGNYSGASIDVSRIKFGDFNGDGITDIYYVNGWGGLSQDKIYLFRSDGTFSMVAGPATSVNSTIDGAAIDISRVKLGDFNGDRITDVYYVNGWGGLSQDKIYLFRSDGTFSMVAGPATSVNSTVDGAKIDISRVEFGDFNGDGITDVYYVDGWGGPAQDKIYLFRSDGTYNTVVGPATSVNSTSAGAKIDISRIKFGDFNGDGITDIYYVDGWGGPAQDKIYLFGSDGTYNTVIGPATYVNSTTAGAPIDISRIKFGDFNGDGITDVYYVNGWGGAAQDKIYLFSSDGTYSTVNGLLTSVVNSNNGAPIDISRINFGDFNGDGITDIYYVNGWGGSSQDKIYLFKYDGSYSTFNGLVTSINNNVSGASIDISRIKFGDFNGDGITDVYYVSGWGGAATDTVYPVLGEESISSINTLQTSIAIQFERLNQFQSYAQGYDYTYPDVSIASPMKVVSRVDKSDGVDGVNATIYKYEGLKAQMQGLGILGFGAITVTDDKTGIREVTNYSQDWQKNTTGMVVSTQTIAPDGTVLSESINELDNRFEGLYTDRYLPYIKSTTSVQRDLDGSVINTTTLEHLLNDEGWVIEDQTCVTPDDLMAGIAGDMSLNSIVPCASMAGKETHKTTLYDYYPIETAPEFAPLLERKTTSITIPDTPPFQPATETRVVAYDYYLSTGQVKSETLEPDRAEYWLTKSYTYHSTGQMETTTVSGADIQPRTSRVVYDAVTAMPIEKINAKGHKQQFKYEDDRFPWLATKVIGPNGGWTKTYYNSWGVKDRAESGHGSTLFGWSTSEKRWCAGDAQCESGELFYEVTDSATTQPVYLYFDGLGREVRRQSSTLRNGEVATVFKRTEYNELGQVVWAGQPYFAGSTVEYGMVSAYDLLGRPETIEDAANQISTIEYRGRTVIYTDPKLHKKTVVKNALGQKIQVRDNRDNAIAYRYDAFGNMVYMVDPEGNETKIGFNVRGFKTQLDDPDQGVWTYAYNTLGELTDQTDAKQQVTHTEYDLLGRMISRTDHYGTPQAETSNWYYDDTSISATAIGKLTQVTNNQNYAQTIRYDAFGRPYETTTIMDGTAYTNSTSYDAFGRVLKSVYPTGFAIENRYHSVLGTLESIVKADADTNPDNNYLYWKAESFSAAGQLQQSSLGGIISNTWSHNEATGMVEDITATHSYTGVKYQQLSYSWDSVGNLESFNDVRQGVSETYTYDDLDRLLDVNSANGITSTRYDELGNITSKTNVGSYSYDLSIPGECGTGYSAPGPHAVHRIAGAKANYFCYDANGNLVKDKDRNLKYTGFNKPYEINRGATRVNFEYGPSRARFKREDITNGSVSSTTYYLGAYEKEIVGGVTKHKIVIGGSVQLIEESGGATNVNYFLKDHLGSITAIVNEWGTPQEELSYDAWGNRRLTNLMLLSAPLSYKNDFTNRGFTGHEHVDSVGLIHMNGRVYDPVISRFLSADPIVQAPSNLQSLNRYSYVMNNPLSMVDPSGFSWLSKKWKSAKKRVKRFVSAAIGGQIVTGFTGAVFGYQYRKARDLGLSASEARKFGAKATAIQSAIAASSVVSHVAGNALNVYFSNFVAAYGSKVVAEGITRVAVHALIGGTTAKIGGGNFADGASVSGGRMLYSFAMGSSHGYFNFTENPVLSTLEQVAVAAALAKSRGMDSSSAAINQVAVSLMSYWFNDNGNYAQKGVTSTSSVNSETGEHVYTITGTICAESATCNEAYANEVFDYVNGNDVPFGANSVGNGERSLIPYLPRPLGSQPIYHYEVPSMRMSLNVTFPGHNFHPGTVTHQVGFMNGNLTYTVTGNGIGDSPNFNNWAGEKLFRPGVENVVQRFGR